MSRRGIEAPYTIATLPKPLDGENGRTQAAVVQSLHGSRKRKRHEVAVGIDGESVTIYNVQNQFIASSYALPPQSHLAAAPCSIYCKRAKPFGSQRHTYLAVRNGPSDRKARLVRITETLGNPRSEEREPRLPERQELKLRHGDVACLDIVPFTELAHEAPAVLICYKSGNVDFIPGRLTSARWQHTLDELVEVEHSVVLDCETARKGVLRGREDLVALLDPNTSDKTALLLCQVVRMQGKRHFRIYVLRGVGAIGLQGQQPWMEELASYGLPGAQSEGSVQYELHAGSGLLYQRINRRLTMFDLSGTSPKISFELRKSSHQASSFVRLSNAAVLVANQSRVSVCETKFGSTMDTIALRQENNGDSPSEQNSPVLRLLSNFSDLGVVVALSGQHLIAIQLGEANGNTSLSRTQGPLLSDILGKGKYGGENEVSESKEKKKRKWEAWTAAVDRSVEHEDFEGLENIVAEDINYKPDFSQSEPSLPANGHDHKRPRPEWHLLPHHCDPQNFNSKKAVYILSKIFTRQSTPDDLGNGNNILHVTFPSRNILRWLALAGYLNISEIARALPQTAPGVDQRSTINPGDIMIAMGNADSSFGLLNSLLSLAAFWDLAEVVQALKILIESFEDKDDLSRNVLRITEDTSMDGTDEASVIRIAAEEAAAIREIEQATSVLESGLHQRSRAFRKCLDRLQEFPHKDVSRTLRSMMAQENIIFFIQIMRVELANGGWTRQYELQTGESQPDGIKDLDSNVQELSSSNQAIRTIAQLISCAVDAIGLSGWLVGLSGDRYVTDELLDSLLVEINAVMEGAYYSSNLHAILKEAERSAASVQSSQTIKRKWEEVEPTPESLLMPLGGRRDPPLVGKSAEGRKSKGFAAEQKHRGLGTYSFERIRI